MNVRGLLSFFAERREAGRPMVLVSVFETRGSTYSKAGDQMLIDSDGDFHGMLSGGCLEGDLAARAAKVIESGAPQAVTYDLANDDELWGLGVGCDGLMRMLLQPLYAESGHQPFADIANCLTGDIPFRIRIVVERGTESLPIGASVIDQGTQSFTFNVGEGKMLDESSAKLLDATITPPPHILVLGAGMDAEPVVRLASELGWRCTVVDHRESYVSRGAFTEAESVRCLPPGELSASIDLSRFSAAIVMSHHLASDRTYLRQLAGSGVAYVGLLGPATRRERLLDELGGAADGLADRLHGPAGLDIGGRGPAAIALSIVAQIQDSLQ